MKVKFFLLALVVFSMHFCCRSFQPSSNSGSSSTSTSKPRYNTTFNFEKSNSLTKLLDRAERENKLVFVDMWIENCPPCKVMDENVFTDRDLGAQFNRDFINYKLNGTDDKNGPDVAAIYNVFFYPTLLILNSDGQVLARKEGGASVTQLREMAREALANRLN